MSETRVGVVDRGESSAASEAVADAGAVPVVDDPAALADADVAAVVAPGEAALRSTVVRPPDAPVVPVDADPGVASVPADRIPAVVGRIVEGEYDARRHPLLSVSVDGDPAGRLFRELALVADAPARISEFAIESATAGSVGAVRADGVVVATPAGSHGYAAAGDGPLLAPGTGLVTVPVAPFLTDPDRWVLPTERVELRVRRDETPVAVEVDGREVATVGADDAVVLAPDGAVRIASFPESTPTFR